MKKEMMVEEGGLELAETTGVDIHQVMKNNEDAINALSAFAQPIKVELVHPPKPVKTVICFEVCQVPSESELKAARRSKAARTVTKFDLLALASMSGLAAARFGVLDLVSLWT